MPHNAEEFRAQEARTRTACFADPFRSLQAVAPAVDPLGNPLRLRAEQDLDSLSPAIAGWSAAESESDPAAAHVVSSDPREQQADLASKLVDEGAFCGRREGRQDQGETRDSSSYGCHRTRCLATHSR